MQNFKTGLMALFNGWGIINPWDDGGWQGAVLCETIASVRWLLKHYRLWNDGLRPGIGPPRRKEGSRRGRPTIVIIATPFQHPFASTSHLCIEICWLNLGHISILRGTFHISLREFFSRSTTRINKTSARWIILTSSHQGNHQRFENNWFFLRAFLSLLSSCPIFLLIIHSIPDMRPTERIHHT